MTFKTFFFILFILSTMVSALFSFFIFEAELLLREIDIAYKTTPTFISLVALISATFSYIGLTISSYLSKKREEIKRKKVEAERKSLSKIHQELKALRQGISIG